MAAFLHFLDSLRSLNTQRNKGAPPKRNRIGLALSSGGAKGLAHIGVIQVLEENGIEVDVIAGTSMGAYVGGLWASGIPGKELEKLAASMSSKGKLWELVDPLIPPRRGFVKGKKILKRLRESLGASEFSDLKTPFYCVATELNGYARAVLHNGDVASAILASLAIPGIVQPVLRNGVEYIDGGVSDPLPVNLLREVAGVDKVIATNVIPKISQTRRFNSPTPHYNFLRNPIRFLNQHLNLFARGNLLDILRGSAMGSQMRLVDRSARRADVLIEAISPVPRWHDYNRFEDYIRLGREAAEEMLPELLKLQEEEEAEVEARKTTLPTEEDREVKTCA